MKKKPISFPSAYGNNHAWTLSFPYGSVNFKGNSYFNRLRLVRGGQCFWFFTSNCWISHEFIRENGSEYMVALIISLF